MPRRRPGVVRDAIVAVLGDRTDSATVAEITAAVRQRLGADVPGSSIRSYLRLNTPDLFCRPTRGHYHLAAGTDLSGATQ